MAFTPKDWHDYPTQTDTPLTAAALEDMETRLSDYTDATPEFVTSLPASPVDGKQVIYQASGGLFTVLWHLRFNASIATYKWEYLGGSPIFAEGDSTGFAVGGPSNFTNDVAITLPNSGEYIVHIGSGINRSDSTAAVAHVELWDGTSTAVSNSRFRTTMNWTAANGTNDVVAGSRLTHYSNGNFLTGGHVYRLRATVTGTTLNIRASILELWPLRII